MASDPRGLALVAIAVLSSACASELRQYPLAEPVWIDDDRRPFAEQPEEYFSPFAWDGADQTLFRPMSRFFAVDPAGASKNVNALDEVPDSSWFENRIGRYAMTPEQAARGPCTTPQPGTDKTWLVTGAKPNGENPGFLLKAEGQRYLVKFDGTVQGPRTSTADVVGSRIYHAAGYFVPCNRVIHFERKILKLAPDAKSETATGEEEPMTEKHLDKVFKKGIRLPDGRYRANLSLFVEGKPLGPWTYQDTRSDDPNDVIDHEDRRELRGMRLLGAWISHFDSREQNTLASWIEVGKHGYIRHNLIDFGDSFGSVWDPPMLGRRIGQSYYLDIPDVLEDWLSLGAARRSWDVQRFGSTGPVFGYFDVEHFDPEEWKPGYPNPAFGRMREHDAAWMARIIARFSYQHVHKMVEMAHISAELDHELTRILMGRRDKILRRWLTRLSPLTDPRVKLVDGKAQLCLEDLELVSKIAQAGTRRYGSRAWLGERLAQTKLGRIRLQNQRLVCVALPDARSGGYLIVDLVAGSVGRDPTKPARVHLYQLGPANYRVVGLERPDDFEPPG